jgi:hypothetical protein
MDGMGWMRGLVGVALTTGLTLAGCAASRGAAVPGSTTPGPAGPGGRARECEDFVKRFRYAEKSVAGRAAATMILAPLAVGIGLAGTVTGDLRGLALAVTGPVQMLHGTAQAAKDNTERFERLRQACEEGGGPDTAAAARAVHDLAEARRGEGSTRDAIRLHRDSLAILDRAGAMESEDAAEAALALASLIEAKTPADPEIGPLHERAIRIREGGADARPRELETVLARHARWLRASGRVAEAEAMEARVEALNREIEAAEARSPAVPDQTPGVSGTDITVGEGCAQAAVSVLDRLNEEVAAQGGTARVLAVDCHTDGWVSTVRLRTPAGASYVLMLSEPDADLAERVRPALLTGESGEP